MNLSIIIPLLNEEESLQELHDWIVRVMTQNNYSYEVIFIDENKDSPGSLIRQAERVHMIPYDMLVHMNKEMYRCKR